MTMPESIREEQRAVLASLLDLLRMFGDANDAEDHGFPDVAQQERKAACAAINASMARHSFLSELLPALQTELDSLKISTYGWAELFQTANALLRLPAK
jgi:hypothetical protein